MADIYRANSPGKPKKRCWLIRLIILLLVIAPTAAGYVVIKDLLKPQTTIKQSKPTERKVTYDDAKTKHYEFTDFTVDIPAAWKPVARPAGPYQTYSWQTSENGTNGQVIDIYEDTIPPNYGFNRVLVVSGQEDHMSIEGTVSDNCSKYTKKSVIASGQISVVAKWQGVDFLCDLGNTQRDVTGTTSTDGVNTVILKNPSTGATHKFLFSYTNHGLNPDYNVFNQAIQSVRMQ